MITVFKGCLQEGRKFKRLNVINNAVKYALNIQAIG